MCTDPALKLTHACVITDDVARLRDFYADVLRMSPTRAHDDYVEFATAGGALSLYARSKLEPYAPGAARPGRSIYFRDPDGNLVNLYTRV